MGTWGLWLGDANGRALGTETQSPGCQAGHCPNPGEKLKWAPVTAHREQQATGFCLPTSPHLLRRPPDSGVKANCG